jgi:hypothetical protein
MPDQLKTDFAQSSAALNTPIVGATCTLASELEYICAIPRYFLKLGFLYETIASANTVIGKMTGYGEGNGVSGTPIELATAFERISAIPCQYIRMPHSASMIGKWKYIHRLLADQTVEVRGHMLPPVLAC